MTNYPNGVATFGFPILPEIPAGAGVSLGNVWYVHSGSGSDGNVGSSPARALKTLGKAITLANATGYRTKLQGTSTDDVIFVLPGHSETLVAAAGIAVSKAGLNIIGLGTGRNRPIFNYTTSAAASFDITAANVTLANLVFNPVGVASVTAAVNVKTAANDVTFQGCEFVLSNATNGALIGILADALSHRLRVLDCKFVGGSTASGPGIQLTGGATACDGIEIRRCLFQAAFGSGVGAIQQLTASITNCVIEGNVINNLTASCTKAMVFTSTSTGQIVRNYMQILSGTAPITGAAMSWVGGNYYAAVIATAGTLI